jgi:hypothetical protein
MALSDSIEWFMGILDDGQIQLRRTRIIYDGAEEVARKHFRQVLQPGQDVSSFPARVRNVAAVVWTPAVISAWQQKQAAIAALLPR